MNPRMYSKSSTLQHNGIEPKKKKKVKDIKKKSSFERNKKHDLSWARAICHKIKSLHIPIFKIIFDCKTKSTNWIGFIFVAKHNKLHHDFRMHFLKSSIG